MKDKDLFIKWRSSLGISQTQAAKILGLKSRQSIWEYETGKTKISKTVKTLMKYITG